MQVSNLLIGAEPNTVWLKPELGTHGQTRRLRTSVDCSGLCEGKEKNLVSRNFKIGFSLTDAKELSFLGAVPGTFAINRGTLPRRFLQP